MRLFLVNRMTLGQRAVVSWTMPDQDSIASVW
jgi:hypothetical protein